MSMNFNNLVKALTCNNSADEANNLGCGNKRCKYRDVDGACDIVGMCEDAAIVIKQLAAIMNILGDDYDLDRLRELWKANQEGKVHIVGRCLDCKHYEGLAECKYLGVCGGSNWICGWFEPKEGARQDG